jgi:hypothetical protein
VNLPPIFFYYFHVNFLKEDLHGSSFRIIPYHILTY